MRSHKYLVGRAILGAALLSAATQGAPKNSETFAILKERFLPAAIAREIIGMEIAQVPDAFSSKLLRFYTAGTEGAKGTCMRRSYIVADMAHPSGYAIYDQVAVRIGSCASQDSGFGQVQPSGSSAKDASYALAAIAAAQSGRQASGDPVYQFQCHEHADCRQLVGIALKRINLRRLRLLERSAGGMWSLTFGSEKKGGVPSTFDVDCRSARCTISLASTSPAPF